jgi:serine/threonine-protein kinase
VTAVVDKLFLDFQTALAGRYSLERELGRGGMGVVYLAREVRLDRPVAVKLLPPTKAADTTLRERFLREARTAAKLSHPNIVQIYAVDEVEQFVFFVMAYIEGETLTRRVGERGPLPVSEASRVLRDVAWGLGYAHAQGLVHRDVKPDNILLESGSGRAIVADFGIAAAVHGGAGLDGERVVGTPEFMAPEQALGEAIDARSDLYALGVTAYFALSGRLPFTGADATEVLARQVSEAPAALADAGTPVPRKLATIVHQCLAKDRRERPASAADVANQLTIALERRKELPLALRAFVKHDSRLAGLGAGIYPFGALIGILVFARGLTDVQSFGLLAGSLVAGPLTVLVLRARALLRVGFGHGDLEPAFKVEIEQSREERAFGVGLAPSRLERLVRAGVVAGWGTLFVCVGLGFTGMVTSRVSAMVLGGFALAGLLTGVGSTIGWLIMLQRRRDVDTEFYGRLWTGRVGRWLFRIARWFTPHRPPPAMLTQRPTEVTIALAADQLYEKLDKATRKRLGDLPAAVRGLERDAQRMRARLEVLQEALSGAAERSGAAPHERRDRILAELQQERDLVQQRLGEAVAALETIRLGLLRLHAGTATVQSLTTDLGLARRVAKDVDQLLDGHREVERLLASTPDTDRA